MSPINTTNTSICEVSNIFTGGGPGDQGALVEVNGQQFIPSPFIDISLEKYQMDNTIIGGVMKITLNGVVVDNSFSGVTSELLQILGSNIGANSDCVNVKINCGGTFINGYGRVVSVNMGEGQQPTWVNLAPYSVEIELYENNGSPVVTPSLSSFSGLALSNFEESFTLNIDEDTFNWAVPSGIISSVDGVGNRHVKINFSISAAGIAGCDSGSLTYGLEAAETLIENRIDDLQSGNVAIGTTNLNNDIAVYLDHSYIDLRNVTVNTASNSISVEGSVIYRPDCKFPNVFTTLNVSESVDTEGSTITIAGTITGLYNMVYTNIIADLSGDATDCAFNTKMNAAEAFLSVINDEDVLSAIALANAGSRSYIIDNCNITGNNNPCGSIIPYASPDLCTFRLISSQIDRDFSNGSINFNFQLSNKNNCSIPGASKVDVEITRDFPHDNIVEILIPGRGNAGSIIQNLCCKSAEKMTISLNATLNTSNCNLTGGNIDSVRQCATAILNEIKANGDVDTSCWFVVNDQETTGNNSYRLLQELIKPNHL